MKPDPTPNQTEMQWNIDRYLLDDPTLDREAFEQQMLSDELLAEQVAASVANLHLLAQAACSVKTPSTQPARHHLVSSPALWSILTSAAVLIVAVSSWQFIERSNDKQLARIADNWSAIENLSTSESLDLVYAADVSDIPTIESSSSLPADDATDGDTREQSDWLVEAAREFYLANNEGAAG